MRLLFIKLKHIGDSLLLTPTLSAVKARYPDAEIWVAVRAGCESILEGCPAIDHIVSFAPPETTKRTVADFWREMGLVRTLRRRHFDYAFELGDGDRGRILSFLSGARKRCANANRTGLGWVTKRQFHCLSEFDWWHRHRVEKDFFTVSACLPLGETIPPLCFARERTQSWEPGEALAEFAVLHPATRWKRKRWPTEKWIEIARRLLTALRAVVVSAGPDPAEKHLAAEICSELGEQAISTNGETNWAQLAGLLYRARLFVGVDTAAMHLAAACQCPTVAIFGPSVESAWRPWQAEHRIVLAPESRLDPNDSDYFRKKETWRADSVSVDDVWTACQEMLVLRACSVQI